MRRIVLSEQTDLDGFRAAARTLVADGVPPPLVDWRVEGDASPGLFDGASAPGTANPPDHAATTLRVPRAFLALAEAVICHSDPERFALLYRLLWRLTVETHLMQIPTDRDVAAARRMEKAVGRDVHKMHAFVRFRAVTGPDGGERFVAWFEPEHFIEERAAPFFAGRFAGMDWTIVTPRVTVVWTGEALVFGPGGRRGDAPREDASEELWRTYYASIFNPARLKVKAMTAEMPRRYWRNLPEAALIPQLIAGAEARARAMVDAGPTMPSPTHLGLRRRAPAMPPPDAHPQDLDGLRAAAADCRRCPLFEPATQTVFGEGPADAEVMFVGEQPGDQEDLQGRPFVGPAGRLFDAALEEAGILRDRIYVTNAVKHFKFEPRGRRRIHKKPNGQEIQACRWWLEKEVTLLAPKLIVGLGATALQSLLDRPVKITEERGRFFEFSNAPAVFATVHPSYLLRLPDPALKAREQQRFVDDLKRVAERLAG